MEARESCLRRVEALDQELSRGAASRKLDASASVQVGFQPVVFSVSCLCVAREVLSILPRV